MIPELFSIGPFTVHSFGLMMALGFVSAGAVTYFGFKRAGFNPETVYWITIAAAVGGIVGSKIHYLLLHPDNLADDPLATAFSGAGLVWYGGFIGGLAAGLLVTRLYRIPLGKAINAAAPAMAIGYGFGRLGCFLNGDDYGQPSTLPWAMAFPEGSPPVHVAVQPTQLYEAAAAFAIFFLLLYLRRWFKRGWSLFLVFLVLAGVERFLVEFVRWNRPGQTQQQVLAAATAVVAAAVLIWVERRHESH
ncbi:MAG: prolipoprotein diacylglyceryl transferase [Gaiellales bacterium]|nr:MAG: prolipoprotein diacylglyceryl transferase [Gaiellales bacterium]